MPKQIKEFQLGIDGTHNYEYSDGSIGSVSLTALEEQVGAQSIVIFSVATETPAQAVARVNSILSQSPAAGLVLPVRLVGSFVVDAPFVVRSNTYIDATMAQVSAPSTTHSLLKNFSDGSAVTRDVNISVIGGKWTAGSIDGDTHRMKFHRVTGLVVDQCEFSSTSGKYAVSLADVSQFRVENIFLNGVKSDGVHVTGPASLGTIRNIYGTTDDDVVALGCSDYLAYDYSRGDIDNIVVENIKCVNLLEGRGVLLFTTGHVSITNTMKIKNVVIDGVSGTVGAAGVYFSDDIVNANANTENVFVRNIATKVPSGYPLVGFDSFNRVAGVVVDGVTIPASAADDTTAVKINRAFAGSSFAVSNIRSAVTNTAVSQTMVGVAASISNLVLSDVQVDYTTNGFSRVVRVYNNATIGSVIANNVCVTGNNESFRLDSGSTLSRLLLNNVSLGSTGSLIRHKAATAMELVMNGVVCGGTLIGFDTAGGSATVRSQGHIQTAGSPITRSASQVIRSRAFDFSCDVSLLSRNAGDMATNTNAGLACGVGPVICTGPSWKNIATDAIYT
jgi:hypothetical protein